MQNPTDRLWALLAQCDTIALDYIKQEVRTILLDENNSLITFILAMGTACFYDADGPVYDEELPDSTKTVLEFIYEFDSQLKLTGSTLKMEWFNGQVNIVKDF